MIPLADHGNLLMALPFVLPMLVVVLLLGGMVARDRIQRRRASRSVD